MTISILICLTAILPPVVLLTLYPVTSFRSKFCSSRCMASLTLFIEKFYSCHWNGLDGRRDIRIWASAPFLVILSTVFALNADNNYMLSMFCIYMLESYYCHHSSLWGDIHGYNWYLYLCKYINCINFALYDY